MSVNVIRNYDSNNFFELLHAKFQNTLERMKKRKLNYF